tara:strand:- start:8710 stop:10773 length:2064 start_codon:yes stop_codon:yes gene_type:complete
MMPEIDTDNARKIIAQRFTQIGTGTENLTGFRSDTGRQLAIMNRRPFATLWVEDCRSDDPEIEIRNNEHPGQAYSPDQRRDSNLKANAPNLARGNKAYLIRFHSSAAFERFIDWYATLPEKPEIDENAEGLELLRQVFLRHVPDFTDFTDKKTTFYSDERVYKDELVSNYREHVRPHLEKAGQSDEESLKAIEALRHLLTKEKMPSTNKVQNLIGWRWTDHLLHLDDSELVQAGRLYHGLLFGEGDVYARIDVFSEGYFPLIKKNAIAGGQAALRALASLFLMLEDPANYIFIRTTLFDNLNQTLNGEKLFGFGSVLSGEDYRNVMDLSNQVREALESWGWSPLDMIDVQGFIWVAASGTYDIEQEEDEADDIIAGGYVPPSLEQVVQAVGDEGLRLEQRLIRRYHMSVLSRGFVILSGNSGSGKTWLADAYARAVGAKALVVPVAPNWTSNEDLLGYYNPLDDQYHDTPFSSFLRRAEVEFDRAKRQGVTPRPFHLILDEMNLARVEYYFAKFLSAMEMRARRGEAGIELAPGEFVRLLPNLRFIGTVNVDETTQSFADKVYDRAQLIEVESPRELILSHMDGQPFQAMLMAVWDAVADIAPFSFRVIDDVRAYTELGNEMSVSWQEALDEQISQKVLPKIKGGDPRVAGALMQLIEISGDDLPLTTAKANKMLVQFNDHGFTSYF